IHSNVPLGGGLSSSASLEVAVATLVQSLAEQKLDPVATALLCQKAEHEFAKMPCGIMDQFISVLGQKDHAMLLDCRSYTPTMVPLADPGIQVLITNSNVKHSLTGSEYPQRRKACEDASKILGVAKLRDANMTMLLDAREQLGDVVFRRAKHVIGENDRTQRMANALTCADWNEVGKLMYASHDSLRDDFEVSCPELDVLVELARAADKSFGVIGSRMTGGGFGGCTVSLIKADHVAEYSQYLSKEYYAQTGIEPTLFTTRPARGGYRMF
ncbi:MAG: galactokinase, partial [Planctomycetia bacterium]|nr:galactokinase [Planctomycetia bacterium]